MRTYDHSGGALARFCAEVSVKRNTTEVVMQKYSTRFDSDERRVVGRWRLCVLAFYGSVVAVLLLSSVIADKFTQTADSTERGAARITASR
jgi:hypothetical protein